MWRAVCNTWRRCPGGGPAGAAAERPKGKAAAPQYVGRARMIPQTCRCVGPAGGADKMFR